ncbi:MAG: GGDEF domain-containing protein, partial [Gammaproteobacteria bacterium]|nr:GGDEF domain-containing protein [Gammaproteobacteria bacterium]
MSVFPQFDQTILVMGAILATTLLFACWSLIGSVRSLRELNQTKRHFAAEHQRRQRLQQRLDRIENDYHDKLWNRTCDYEITQNELQHQSVRLTRANKKLEQLSFVDDLTGVWNRGHFDNMLRTELQRSMRQQTHLGLAIIDIDHFKTYNHLYGIEHGDLV